MQEKLYEVDYKIRTWPYRLLSQSFNYNIEHQRKNKRIPRDFQAGVYNLILTACEKRNTWGKRTSFLIWSRPSWTRDADVSVIFMRVDVYAPRDALRCIEYYYLLQWPRGRNAVSRHRHQWHTFSSLVLCKVAVLSDEIADDGISGFESFGTLVEDRVRGREGRNEVEKISKIYRKWWQYCLRVASGILVQKTVQRVQSIQVRRNTCKVMICILLLDSLRTLSLLYFS